MKVLRDAHLEYAPACDVRFDLENDQYEAQNLSTSERTLYHINSPACCTELRLLSRCVTTLRAEC